MATSLLAIIEMTGAIARLRADRALSEARAAELLSRFREETFARVELFPVNEALLGLAVGVAERYGFRAADSIHLATMIEMARGAAVTGVGFLALVADRRLGSAATAQGISVVNPEDNDALEQVVNFK